jgi:hypothetical protein
MGKYRSSPCISCRGFTEVLIGGTLEFLMWSFFCLFLEEFAEIAKPLN